jgi:GT2 family glycosyltransferase
VVLPTYRRQAALARVLAGLAAQRSAPAFEVIVVDNDDQPHPQPSLPAGLPGRVVTEPTPGAAAARNRGLGEAAAPLVALIDDDVVPDPDWLAMLAAPVLSGRADLTGGRVVLDPLVPRPRWLAVPVEGYLTALELGTDERPLAAGETLLTASLLTRTELFRRIGGFDLRLGPRGRTQLVGDDVQVVRDLRAAGARATWVPAAVVVHELPASRLRPTWILKRAYLQGRSDWRVDRQALRGRRAGGARVALSWWANQWSRRRAEGLRSPAVAFHAACDVARTAGALREATALWGRGPA